MQNINDVEKYFPATLATTEQNKKKNSKRLFPFTGKASKQKKKSNFNTMSLPSGVLVFSSPSRRLLFSSVFVATSVLYETMHRDADYK